MQVIEMRWTRQSKSRRGGRRGGCGCGRGRDDGQSLSSRPRVSVEETWWWRDGRLVDGMLDAKVRYESAGLMLAS